ncbi:hypothetical protein DL767_000582 [Monosporascus sp. MG133]|nr:hypothetical protein DL767_000582 [Monosporascus sp. MG133]
MMPLAHTTRLAPSLARLFLYPTRPPPSDALFRPWSMRSRTCMLECDANLHKSNSTYLIDLDISRAELLTRLFAHALRRTRAGLVLAGVDISFRREIRPLQAYETHSRVLAWDNKWIYVLSYHTKPGIVVDGDAGEDNLGWLEALLGKAESVQTQSSRTTGLVFTVSVSKYVAKAGRRTISPRDLLRAVIKPPPNVGTERFQRAVAVVVSACAIPRTGIIPIPQWARADRAGWREGLAARSFISTRSHF